VKSNLVVRTISHYEEWKQQNENGTIIEFVVDRINLKLMVEQIEEYDLMLKMEMMMMMLMDAYNDCLFPDLAKDNFY
jgi:L-ribulose-5-phosphate 3-epimerase UlaE